jgi:hypothetical protein
MSHSYPNTHRSAESFPLSMPHSKSVHGPRFFLPKRLQVCFGLESLLGDAVGSESLTSTLADRCAYLVGSDIKGRNSIREQFKELYAIRSKLVHGTATWLDPNQRHFLRWERSIFEFAIFQEVKHLGMKHRSFRSEFWCDVRSGRKKTSPSDPARTSTTNFDGRG